MLHFCTVSIREGALVTQPFLKKFLKAFLQAVLSIHQGSFILKSKVSFSVLLKFYLVFVEIYFLMTPDTLFPILLAR